MVGGHVTSSTPGREPDIGILFTFRGDRTDAASTSVRYEKYLQQVQLADELGFDTVWFAEHHFADDGHLPSPLVAAAFAAGITQRIRIATSVVVLPFYNAVRLAEDAAVVDVMSKGRLELGVAQGYAPHEFTGYGVGLDERRQRFTEGLDVVRGLWTNESFSYQGRFYNLVDARLNPSPVQRPHPPLWGGGMTRSAIRRVASSGMHFMAVRNDDIQIYDNALTDAGHDVAAFNVWRNFWVHVAESDKDAASQAAPPIWNVLTEYGTLRRAGGNLDETATLLANVPDARNLSNELELADESLDVRTGGVKFRVGSPETVARLLVSDLRRFRTTHLCLAFHLPGLSDDHAEASMRLFINKVRPAMNRVLANKG
jgi:alkanesulfonate monooxygenase SsuD/methylene tetrahydromethanopterin reductase-like flavin-dependent oxidoreductase (luciferase family)